MIPDFYEKVILVAMFAASYVLLFLLALTSWILIVRSREVSRKRFFACLFLSAALCICLAYPAFFLFINIFNLTKTHWATYLMPLHIPLSASALLGVLLNLVSEYFFPETD